MISVICIIVMSERYFSEKYTLEQLTFYVLTLSLKARQKVPGIAILSKKRVIVKEASSVSDVWG